MEMRNSRIPVYVVCGAQAEMRRNFFREFCKHQKPLWLECPANVTDTEGTPAWRLPAELPPLEAGERIAALVQAGAYDAVWLDWDDALPIDRLLTMLQTRSLYEHCRLRKVVRCAAEATSDTLMAQNVRRQLEQCDLYVLRDGDRRAAAKARHLVQPLQPDMEAVAWADSREVAAVLEGRNVLQGVRFTFVLVAVGALLAALSRLNFSLSNTMAVFLGTYLQALPFLLLGILLSSAIQVFVPAGFLQRVFPKKLLGGMLFGVLGGFILPICDCASIPVFRSLLRKGVPLPAAVTFMIAAPIINPVVMLSTYYAFGCNPRVMLTRMGFGVLCSVLVGLCFAWNPKSVLLNGDDAPTCGCAHGHAEEGEPDATCACGYTDEHDPIHTHEQEHSHKHVHPHEHDEDTQACGCEHTHASVTAEGPSLRHKTGRNITDRLTELLEHFRDEFFEVARFLLIGIGVSTVLQLIMGSNLTSMRFDNLVVAMLVMMAMAFLLSLCSSSDAVVGKNMGASLPMGAVMSFMVFGPMIDVKNVILMSGSFTKRFMLKLMLVTFTVSFVTVYVAFSLGLGALIG